MKEMTKKKGLSRDPKKLLASYKESKESKESKKSSMDINEGLPKIIDEWTPLEYIKHFTIYDKKISTNAKKVIFGRVSFLKDTLCNFKRENGDTVDKEWYSLEHLYLAYFYRHHKHSIYLGRISSDHGKRLSMHHRDRDAFLKYIDGKSSHTPSNVKPRTRRELNPEQYISLEPARKIMDKYSLDRMQKEDEENLKARMQMHILENQQKLQQNMIARQEQSMSIPPPQPMVNVAPTNTSSRSRFDKTYHPSQVARGGPGVVIPQVVGYQEQFPPPQINRRSQEPPPAPWQGQEGASRSSSYRSRSPELMEYGSSRMRSRTPPRMQDALSRAYEDQRARDQLSRPPPPRQTQR